MKSKTKTKLPLVVITGLIILVVAALAIVYFLRQQSPEAATVNPEATTSIFEFTGAEGWRQGPSNETSMALFSKAVADGTSACFTSMEYYGGTVDVDAELAKDNQSITSGGNTVTPLDTKVLSVKTSTGDKRYELRQSKVTSDNAGTVMGGHAIGYVQLEKGYLKTYANCNTAEQLASAIPALEAYRVNNQ